MSHFYVNAKGDIVGPGGLLFPREIQSPPGVVQLDIQLLDRLFELGMAEERVRRTTDGQVMEEARRLQRQRIEAAKADLIDDLGLEMHGLRHK